MDKKSLSVIEACALIVILVFIEYLLLITVYDMGFGLANGDPKGSIVVLLSIGIVISGYVKFSGASYKDIAHPSSGSVVATFLVLLFPIVIIFIGSLGWYENLLIIIDAFLPEDKLALESLGNLISGGLATFIAVCIIAPLMEELLFRGVILGGFLRRYEPTKAIVLSSVLFSLFHWNIYQMPSAFILGALLGWLYYISRSIWPSVFAHFFNNLLVYITYSMELEVGVYSLWGNLFSFLVSLIGFVMIFRIFKLRLSISLLSK